MKSLKVALLSALFCVSATVSADAQKATVRVTHNDIVFDMPVELSDNLQVFVTECGKYQVEFEKTDEANTYCVSIYTKNKKDEWKLMTKSTIQLADSEPATVSMGERREKKDGSIAEDHFVVEIIPST